MNRTFTAVLVVLAVCVVVVGFYRGWFSVSGHGGDAVSNKVEMNLTVDPDKMKEDAGKVQDEAEDLAGK